MAGLEWCDAVVLLLRSGRSAHLEGGWAKGHGKKLYIVLAERPITAELMYKMADGLASDVGSLLHVIALNAGPQPVETTTTTTGAA